MAELTRILGTCSGCRARNNHTTLPPTIAEILISEHPSYREGGFTLSLWRVWYVLEKVLRHLQDKITFNQIRLLLLYTYWLHIFQLQSPPPPRPPEIFTLPHINLFSPYAYVRVLFFFLIGIPSFQACFYSIK